MTDHAARRTNNQLNSLEAFLARKVEFDALAVELQQMSADHFGADPEGVLWGDVAELLRRTMLLHQVTDAYSRRGEFAR